MRTIVAFLIIQTFVVGLTFGQVRTASFNADKMREEIKRISSDEFEGRGPGTAGGKLASQYLADQLKEMGVKPANRGSYFQPVGLFGVKPDPNTLMHIGKTGAADTESYKFGDDFVATTGAQKADAAVDAEAVFVGYGIDAPMYKWNDYKGPASDYRGKVLVMLVNDPPATAAEPNLFGAKALTYYGRWTYKYEEAARRGAVGVILIHTTESAGYGWNVVRSSNGNWRYEITRTPSDKTPFLQFKAWATNEASTRMFKQAGLDLDDLRRAATTRDFQPVKMGLTVKLDLKNETKAFASPNVVGMVEGSDPKLRDEFVVFSAHWDHLGIGEPDANGDRIYNGAYDNGSGDATILGIARVLASMPIKERPKRSFLFLFPTAEEQGLLGSEYYAHHPLFPLDRTAANINIDGANIFGQVSDFMPLGGDRSSMATAINEAAAERSMTVRPDSKPEQGSYFRSDHFSFAKVGVPSISLEHGETFIGKPDPVAYQFFKEYNEKHYHQVSDEYHDWWDMSAMVQEADLALAIGTKIANSLTMPHYEDSDEFSAADKARFRP